jgi:hypothetical protein
VDDHILKRAAIAFIVLSAFVLVPMSVSANITIEPRLEDPFSGILVLAVVNFPVDLLLVSVAVYVALWALGRRAGDISDDAGDFVLSVIVAAAVVAISGAVLDFAFLYEGVDGHYGLRDLSVGVVLPATLLIFATIALSLSAIVRLRVVVSTAAGAAIALLSPVGWWFTAMALSSFLVICLTILILVSAAFALIFLTFTHRLHVRIHAGEADRAYEGGNP